MRTWEDSRIHWRQWILAIARKDDTAVEQLASSFHATIAEASGNWYLCDLLKNVRDVMVRYRPRQIPYTVYEADMQRDHYKSSRH